MNPTQPCCDSSQLSEYLSGQLSGDQQSKLESHLTECEACRREIQELAAEPDIWENAKSLLGHECGESIEETSNEVEREDQVQPGVRILDSLSPTDDPEMLGRLGEYEISGVVGVGGMGAVLRGFDKSLRRVVAIKVMAPHLAGSGPARTRFQREARAAAAITHDNVIDIYGVSEANGLPYIVMPFARGPSLQKRIDQSGPLTALEVSRIGKQIASGLVAAHEQGLVHRDIKPANILLHEGIERLWITDFGVARAMDDASMTKTGVIAGTPQYMSPEQARGETVDHRSDLFSLGSILYTACTGRPPFRSEAAYGVLRRITDTDPRPIREVNPDIPEWLCTIIQRLMAKHPADRFQNAKELAELLEACLAHLQQPDQVKLPASVTPNQVRATDAPEMQTAGQRRRANSPERSRFKKIGVLSMISVLLIAASGFVAMQWTAPSDVSGNWSGTDWKNVSLDTTQEAPGWYSGTFVDRDGGRGVLHLEWSRSQRRFNGRWQVGRDRFGPLTIRAIGKNELRGAISLDPDAKTDPNVARLRDFSWHRAKRSLPSSFRVKDRNVSGESPLAIRSPFDGKVTEIGERILSSSFIRGGDLIAEVTREDQEAEQARHRQLNQLQQQVDAAKELLVAKERELDIAREAVDAERKRLQGYEESVNQVIKMVEVEKASEEQSFAAMKKQLASAQDALSAAKQEWNERQDSADDSGAKEQLPELESKLRVREAKLQELTRTAKANGSAWSRKHLEMDAKLQQARSKMNDVTAELRSAESKLANMNTEIVATKSNLLALVNETKRLQAEQTKYVRVRITAPRSGKIQQANLAKVGAVVKEGDVICLLDPDGDVRPSSGTTMQENSQPEPDESELKGSNSQQMPVLPELDEASAQFAFALGTKEFLELRRDLEASERSLEETRSLEIKSKQQAKELLAKIEEANDQGSGGQYLPGDIKVFEVRLNALQVKLADLKAMAKRYAEKHAELEGRMTQAMKQHSALILILENRRQSAFEILESEEQIRGKIETAYEAGLTSRSELLRSNQKVSEKKAKLREIELLLEYYRNLKDDEE